MWSTNAAALSCPTTQHRRAVLIERGRDGSSAAARALHDDGYDVALCEHSEDALARLREQHADVIVINVSSGGTEAFDLRRAQAEDPSLADIPIVLSADGRQLKGRGVADVYVERPFGTGELLVAVERALLKRERRALAERLEKTERLAMLGTVAASVGHELNNPLTFAMGNYDLAESAIRGFLQGVREPSGVPSRGGDVAGASLQVRLEAVLACFHDGKVGLDRVRRMVDKLADLARGSAGAHRLLSMREVLEASLAMARGELNDRAIVSFRYAPIDPVLGDEPRLGQLFVNLLVNAAQSIPQGHASSNHIRVALYQEGAVVVVEVEDTGGGMSRTQLARIFEPFFTTKAEHGTGLGLPICREIVEEHGGRLDVESTPGEGSRFTVRLPSATPEPVPLSGTRPF
jgi:signal transduction histidine kinase